MASRRTGVVVLCTLFALAPASAASPRTVVIVNAASDQGAGAGLAVRLRAALVASPDLAPLAPGELARALEPALPPLPRHHGALAVAENALTRAGTELARLRYDRALDELALAEAALMTAEPGTPALLAQVTFLRGTILIREGRMDEARVELRAARRLDPSRTELDPVRHPPEIVRAFQEAGTPLPGQGTLRVVTPFDGVEVSIDGQPAGTTPIAVSVEPGARYVAGVHPGSRVTGQRVVVSDRDTSTVRLHLEPVAVDERARRVRRQLLEQVPLTDAPAAQVAAALRSAANLAGVDVVIAIGDSADSRLVVAFLRGAALSSWRVVDTTDMAALLAPLTTSERPRVGDTPPSRDRALQADPARPREPRPVPRWVKATLAGAGAAAILGAALYAVLGNAGPVLVPDSSCCIVDTGPPKRP